jgi:hypothetical protein
MFRKEDKQMRKLLLVVGLCLTAAVVQAQGIYQVRPNPFGGGYNVYSPTGGLSQQIRPNPFGGGYNSYGPSGNLQFQTRPNPFGGGYNIQTMPRYNYGGYRY